MNPKRKHGHGECYGCGGVLERCDDCGQILCWDCEGLDHERDHRDAEREREELHRAVDRGEFDW